MVVGPIEIIRGSKRFLPPPVRWGVELELETGSISLLKSHPSLRGIWCCTYQEQCAIEEEKREALHFEFV